MPGGYIFESVYEMRKSLTLLITLFLVIPVATGIKAAPSYEEQPVVHAVLFWTDGCPYCMETLSTVLPPIQDKYLAQLSIRMIELASSKDVDNLFAFGTSLGLSKEQIAVPFLLVDQTTLVRLAEIKTRLPGLVEEYIAKGGVEVPNFPILSEMLPKGIDFTSSDFYLQPTLQTATTTANTGMTLAWVIMALMGIGLIAAIVMILRAFQGKPLRDFKSWIDIAIPILALIGLGASVYLTFVELTHTNVICGPVGDCNAVQSSPYARLFGFLPVGLLGAIGYIAIFVAWLWRRLRKDALGHAAGPALFGMALFGTLFSIYLTYLEIFVIHAVCIWCLSSAVIITALMLLGLPAITQWLAIPEEEEQAVE